jgi:uncharacterized membrane protein
LVYSGFGFAMAGIEVASWFGPAIESRLRALPKIFVAHALAGAAALLVGPLQFHGGLRRASLQIHRLIGRAYVYGVGISSVTAAYLVPAFDIPMAAKIAFGSLAVLWFATTALGLQRAVNRQIIEHKEWMLRSFALSLFFVTGSLWMGVSRSLSYAEDVTYPMAVFLGWTLNLALAEVWIRSARDTPLEPNPHEPGY